MIALPLLVGCVAPASAPPDAVPAPAERIAQREASLRELQDFSVSGGFSYWDDVQNLSASLQWRQRDDALDIVLRAPLGVGRLDVEQDASGARVQRSGQPPLQGARAAPLLQRALGLAVPVPLEQLGDWIRGLPGDGARSITRDAEGRLQSLRIVDGSGATWRAQVRRYRDVAGLSLPALLTAVSGERHLKLALSRWDTTPIAPDVAPVPAPESSPARRLPLPGT